MVPWWLPVDLPNILAITDCFKTWLVSIERSFQGLPVAIKTVGIVKELMEIWLNEVCDILSTSNLFWGMMVPFLPSFLFLQLQAMCPNFLQHWHNFPFLPSSSSLSLARECFSLSKLLINELYWSRDIVLHLLNRVRS